MKAYHPDLLADLAASSTTLTDLLLIGPLPDLSYRGFTLLDRDVTFDAGFGSRTYKARTGFEMSALQASADLGVDNAEASTLPVLVGFEVEGFTSEQIDAGALDKVPFVVYRVNYENLTTGRCGIVDGGTVGEVRRKVGNLTVIELRSLSNQTKQNIGDVTSLTCRAKFGSQPIGTGGGVVEEAQPCGYDLTAEWVASTVEGVGTESDREFTDSGLIGSGANYFAPGVVEWLTGTNAGQETEIESFDNATGTIVLQFPTTNPIQLGDTCQPRRDCSKNKTGHNSCKDTFHLTQWWAHMRAEPAMPIAEAGKLLTPGAAIGAINTGSGTGEGTPTPVVEVPPESGGAGSPGSPTVRTYGATVVNPVTYGADPTGVADSTAAFNAAYAALPVGGGIVRPAAGTYKINPVVSIKPLSNTFLDLATNSVTLQASYTALDHKYVVWVDQVTEVEIAGGEIIGYRDAWSAISGTTSEWGHGIKVDGATNVTIRDITTTKCVGDGISVGPQGGTTPNDIWIDNVVSTYNRRQGLSITGATGVGVRVTNSEFAYTGGTGGTLPMAGIDVEVDNPLTASANPVTIDTCHCHHNTGNGIEVHEGSSNLTVSNSILEYNAYGLYAVSAASGTLTGNTIQHNQNEGVRLGGTTTGYVIGGASGSADRDTLFNNKTNVHGVITSGSTTERTGTSSATAAHINIGSSSTATVNYNLYGP